MNGPSPIGDRDTLASRYINPPPQVRCAAIRSRFFVWTAGYQSGGSRHSMYAAQEGGQPWPSPRGAKQRVVAAAEEEAAAYTNPQARRESVFALAQSADSIRMIGSAFQNGVTQVISSDRPRSSAQPRMKHTRSTSPGAFHPSGIQQILYPVYQ